MDKSKLRRWWERLIAVNVPDEEEARLGRLFNTLMVISVGVVLVLSFNFILVWLLGYTPLAPAFIGAAFPWSFIPLSLFCLFQAKRGRVRQMITLYVWTHFLGVALAVFLFEGIRSAGWLLFSATIIIAGMLIRPDYALRVAGLVLGYYFVLLVLTLLGIYTPPLTTGPQGQVFSTMFVTLLMPVLTVAVLTYLNTRSLQDALSRLRLTSRELEEQRRTLEDQVAARTADLARRTAQLEAAATVARRAAAIRDVQALLDETVRLISDRFGFYHVGIFLLDERGEYAVLQAASSEGGQRMLARGHRLRVGEGGIVGHVAGTGQPRIALDVGADAVFFDNPDLPRTRSEMALPLKVGERVIGVLDVQSEEPAAFTDEDVAVLQTMADQIALAIENARTLEQMERTVQELERVYGEYTREAWQTVRQARRWVGRRYRRLVPESAEELTEEARRALSEGRSVLQPLREEGDGRVTGTLLAVPMKLRGQVIGALNLRFAAPEVPPEAVQMVEAIADRLALALENARLLEETRRHAERDRRIAEITAKVRASMDPETILRTAARELGAALGVDRVVVHMSPPPSLRRDERDTE
ncbi:MAG: GAF domain-containing protein [Anaerolineae bacterium]